MIIKIKDLRLKIKDTVVFVLVFFVFLIPNSLFLILVSAQDIPLAPGEVLNSNFPRREDIPNNTSPVGGFDPYTSPSNPNYITGNNPPVCGPQGDSYVLCVPLLGITTIKQNSLSDYVRLIYRLALGLGGLLVFIMVVWGGIEYVVSFGSVPKATAARQRIFDAVIGLALLFGSYIILNTINPDLVKLKEPGSDLQNSNAKISNITDRSNTPSPWPILAGGSGLGGATQAINDFQDEAISNKLEETQNNLDQFNKEEQHLKELLSDENISANQKKEYENQLVKIQEQKSLQENKFQSEREINENIKQQRQVELQLRNTSSQEQTKLLEGQRIALENQVYKMLSEYAKKYPPPK